MVGTSVMNELNKWNPDIWIKSYKKGMKANFLKNDENIEKWLRDVFGLQPIPFF